MDNKYTHEEVVLGALLHDVGKMVARLKGGEPYDPDDRNEYKFNHARLTHDFLINTLKVEDVDSVRWNAVSVLAAKHHLPNDSGQKIVQFADCLSSGVDRKTKEDEGFCKACNIQLQSLFAKDGNVIPFKDLCGMGSDPFPMFARHDSRGNELTSYEFYQHAEHLSRELSGNVAPRILVDCIAWFLKEYLYCTPSDMRRATTISLYDHAITTAAIASAVYQFFLATKASVENLESGEPFLIIAGGVDGIQRFISTIQGTKGASKALRGRSLFVQLFTDYVKNRLLHELGLYSSNVIMNAAGKFWILAPNTAETMSKIETIQKEIESTLAKKITFGLSFNIGKTPCSKNDLLKGNFKTLHDKVKTSIQESEKRPFRHVLEDGYVMENAHHASGAESCALCKMHVSAEGEEQCHVCSAMVELGKGLANATSVVWRMSDSGESVLEMLFGEFPKPHIERKKDYSALVRSSDVFTVENIEFGRFRDDPARLILPHRAIGRHVPRDRTGEIIELSDLGESRYLSALKVDVDDLGEHFKKHAVESLSAVSTFARVLDFFFTEFAQYQLEKNDDYNETIYTVFSGGDDFFVLGDLEKIVDFAFYMQERFEAYTGNPEIHFSAGITVHHRNYPVRFIADEVEAELHLAKAADKSKKRMSFQGDVKEWWHAKEWKKTLDKIITEKWCPTILNEDTKFKRDFWRRLLMSCYEYQRVEKEKKTGAKVKNPNDYLYDAHLKYYIARNYDKTTGRPKEFIDTIKKERADTFLNTNFSAIRLALWLAREKEGR